MNQSPDLEECRDFVKKFGKPSFMTKAYGLSLQQILERYLDMWNLSTNLVCSFSPSKFDSLFNIFACSVLDQTNEFIPETRDKFADPVDALKFLLSAYDKTSDEVENILPLPDETRWKNVSFFLVWHFVTKPLYFIRIKNISILDG